MTSFIEITPENLPYFLDHILEIETLSFSTPWSARTFESEINNPVSHLWGLIVDNDLAGYLCFWMFDNEIQVIDIAVHPQRRKQGFGRYLLTALIETGISKGIRTVWLEVRTSNLPARRLYDSLGFRETGRRGRYYTDTQEDAIIMSLVLTKGECHRSAA
jgi:ribosomal-protein-alanine N-acetyltransferase